MDRQQIAYEMGQEAFDQGRACEPPADFKMRYRASWLRGWHDAQDPLRADRYALDPTEAQQDGLGPLSVRARRAYEALWSEA